VAKLGIFYTDVPAGRKKIALPEDHYHNLKEKGWWGEEYMKPSPIECSRLGVQKKGRGRG